jgi:D-alanyl-D-alanine-carboxypeptidase/D-alanyl-D-alanine-endopeptidase
MTLHSSVNIPAGTKRTRNSYFPDDAEIERILAERPGFRQRGVGIVLGLVEGERRRVFSHGHLSQDDASTLDGDTLFELGSVTKVYTSLLLAEMVRRGEAALDEPVQGLLPAGVRVPKRNGRSITLHDLATQTSGLPPVPENFVVGDSRNSYLSYSVDDLYRFLSTHELLHRIGAKFRYSDLNAGLLGHALSCRAGLGYERLVRERILAPLGLDSTAIKLSEALAGRLALGHDAKWNVTPNWEFGPPFAGAGALRSTVHDQLTFIEAMLGARPSSLAAAIEDTFSIRRSRGDRHRRVGLGWGIDILDCDEMFVHGGETAGYSAIVAFLRNAAVGVVVLTNVKRKIADIAFDLINPEVRLSNGVTVDRSHRSKVAG